MPEQRGLRFDAAHAPAEHTEAVDHGGVRVSAYQSVGVDQRRGGAVRSGRVDHHHAGEILQVDLMHDAGSRRHHAEIGKRALAPVQELEPLPVATKLDGGVARQRVGGAEVVHLHRVIDHQIGGRLRIDLGRITAEPRHGGAHGAQVDYRRNAGQVLHDHAGGTVRQARALLRPRLPGSQLQHLLPGNGAFVATAQQRLQQNAQRIGQPGQVGRAVRRQGGEAVVSIAVAFHAQFGARTKGICHDRRRYLRSTKYAPATTSVQHRHDTPRRY